MPIDDAAFREYLKNPILFPPAFRDWVSDWYATNVPKLHVSQVFGFKLHSIYVADDVIANEAMSSTAYGDLATVGPTLSNLANGFYVVMWGCLTSVNATTAGYMSIQVDGVAPTGEREMLLQSIEGDMSVGRVALVDLSQGDQAHEIQAKYKVSGSAGATVSFRWLHALRVVTR